MTNEEATIDIPAAQSRLQEILKPNGGVNLAAVSAQAPAQPVTRKKRSDAGIPKRPPADPDEITLKLTLDDARQAAFQLSDSELTSHIATKVQDQIIAHLQKRLDLLTKQK